jgi:predicted NBD/HSP70 family sugar kinase
MGFALGLDVGGTKAYGVVLGDSDEVLAADQTATSAGAAGVRSTIASLASGLAGAVGVPLGAFTSVGVGIPGVVDAATGVVETAVNLEVSRLDLGALLADVFAVPVVAENDVKATALGAARKLGSADLCYLNVGTGIAAAAVIRGQLLRGKLNCAGEVGHLSLDPAGEPCRCGQRGCIETVAGGAHLKQRLGALGMDIEDLDSTDNPVAAAEAARLAEALARAVTLLVLAYDPEAVVLGGGVLRTAEAWLPAAIAGVLDGWAASSPLLAKLAIPDRICRLDGDAEVAAIGCALVGRQAP